ncbi:DUF115 domain-containing protein [Romboutsia maritimum]|uniref:DUF115 domain-containing protein n=1 Tax=Romboutsia maritimum TaxID=2020948 RepID=A0A371IS61_9FIRM|nr:6-hydroxymethylpterin diphosphokinase MptE-like protein [Romboutsia maritimum]RDY23322.1 DUF115 domain-containing protein [Romboutsia maritimum]
MFNLKKHKSKDNYELYEVDIDNKVYFLGDKENYKKNIQDLIDNLEGLLFDSIVFIFGIDSGEYINELENNICSYNKVIIIEPNKEIYESHKEIISKDNIKLILYDEEVIENFLKGLINYKNFNRLFVHSFGNYENVYKEEYKKFIEILDNRYLVAMSTLGLDNMFRKIFFENMISNLSQLNNSSPLNSYIECNNNIPAIIVSAGPSLDENIQTMLKYKDYLDKFFIIAGNRTMGTLIENEIIPNLVISVDPAQINYDMMKKYLNSDVPFAFYEYSNKDLVKEYKGEKIYISQLFSRTIEDLKNLTGTYTGGSVAHICIDTARLMGCNPIILVGQDCALTYDKHHSDNATFDIDKNPGELEKILVKDVYGNEIKTTLSLNFFKMKIEEYIKIIQQQNDVKFINASYGADIIGAPHKELEEVITSINFSKCVKKLVPDKSISIDSSEIVKSILQHINKFIYKSDECINLCNKLLNSKAKESLMDMKEDDINLQQFLYIMEIIDEFEYSTISYYLGSYLTKFLFDIRQKYFEMTAKDYDQLTSNFKYQCSTFLNYFKELKTMLEEVKEVFLKVSQNVN